MPSKSLFSCPFSQRHTAEILCRARLEWLAKADYNDERMLIVVDSGWG